MFTDKKQQQYVWGESSDKKDFDRLQESINAVLFSLDSIKSMHTVIILCFSDEVVQMSCNNTPLKPYNN